MNVALPRELEALVRAKLASGVYDSPLEVIREALILLGERDQTRASRRQRLLRELATGIDQANDRQLVDALEVFRRLRNKAGDLA
ncbi:MAG: type II toxin-antitoxin system ParD family antitoxin [Burkholderiales bacterium]|nr:type II toxin-antitoxin system ParD family antitoxin [Burkholderiales bacterium]